jgi:hypothetical protein
MSYSPTGRGRPVGAWLADDQVKPCGTRAAWRRHRYHGEDPCEKCREGERVRKSLQRAAQRAAGEKVQR